MSETTTRAGHGWRSNYAAPQLTGRPGGAPSPTSSGQPGGGQAGGGIGDIGQAARTIADSRKKAAERTAAQRALTERQRAVGTRSASYEDAMHRGAATGANGVPPAEAPDALSSSAGTGLGGAAPADDSLWGQASSAVSGAWDSLRGGLGFAAGGAVGDQWAGLYGQGASIPDTHPIKAPAPGPTEVFGNKASQSKGMAFAGGGDVNQWQHLYGVNNAASARPIAAPAPASGGGGGKGGGGGGGINPLQAYKAYQQFAGKTPTSPTTPATPSTPQQVPGDPATPEPVNATAPTVEAPAPAAPAVEAPIAEAPALAAPVAEAPAIAAPAVAEAPAAGIAAASAPADAAAAAGGLGSSIGSGIAAVGDGIAAGASGLASAAGAAGSALAGGAAAAGSAIAGAAAAGGAAAEGVAAAIAAAIAACCCADGGVVTGLAAGGVAPSPEDGGAGSRATMRPDPQLDSHGYGLVPGATPGRADQVATKLRQGSYVIPADVVSGAGQGNTQAGAKAIMQRMRHASSGAPGYGQGGVVDVRLSGGEVVIPPEDVVAMGDGDHDKGANQLDQFIKAVRAHVAQTVTRMAPPR
jgi:hypothetical protein